MNSTINKTELISKLQTLEGLTNEERSNLIDLLRQHKKYGLVWEDKPEDVEERLRDELPVLHEVKERFIDSDAPDAPNHILIEGDNLEALTTLSYTHEGKIDVIYIDPPYNTGNKDFVYNDSFVDSEDSYRHSKWLSFMNKRLKIAKRLLSDKGVVFISIDDNEQANLKLLCDEIFGENNNVGNICRATGTTTGQDANKIGSSFDYCLVYRKNDSFILNGVPLSEKDLKRFKDKDEQGYFSTLQLRKTGNADRREDRPNMFYPIYAPDGSAVYPFGPGNYLSRWRVAKISYEKLLKDDMIVWKKDDKTELIIVDGIQKSVWTPYVKYYSEGRTKQVSNLFQELEGNKKASLQIKEIFGGKGLFEYPKPIEFINILLTIGGCSQSTILDFFAGSGTTLHATMQLNAEDGGHRQCILVTNNENNICEEVTYERNKRVINGYTTPKGVEVEGLKNNRLRYYKTDFISRDRTMRNMRQLVAASTDMLCIKEDLYTEQKMFGRWKINPKVARYFSDGEKHMMVVYDERAVEQLPTMIAETDFGGKKLKIYIFSPERYAFDDDFYEVQDKVQLVALPAAIYDAYQKVLPKRKPQLLDVAEEVKPIPTDLFGEEEKGGER